MWAPRDRPSPSPSTGASQPGARLAVAGAWAALAVAGALAAGYAASHGAPPASAVAVVTGPTVAVRAVPARLAPRRRGSLRASVADGVSDDVQLETASSSQDWGDLAASPAGPPRSRPARWLSPAAVAAAALLAGVALGLGALLLPRLRRPPARRRLCMMAASGRPYGFARRRGSAPRTPLVPSRALGGEGYEEQYDDVEVYLMHFLTYKALRFVLNDLAEQDEAETDYTYLHRFMTSHTSVATDSETFLKELASERPDLALAVSDTRLQIFSEWMEKYDKLALYERLKASSLAVMRHQLYQTVIFDPNDHITNAKDA